MVHSGDAAAAGAAASPPESLAAGASAGMLLGCSLAWLAGVGLQLGHAELPTRMMLLGGLFLGLLGLAVALLMLRSIQRPARDGGPLRATALHRRRAAAGAALLLAVAGAGWSLTGWQAAQRLAQQLPAGLEGRDLVVTGLVDDLPQLTPNGLRFRFRPDSGRAFGEPVQLPPRLAISWYSGWHEDATLTPAQASLRAGQRWTFTLRLRRPHGNLNPHGFDHELALFEQRLGATGYVRDGPVRPRLDAAAAGHPVARLRQQVRDAIQAAVADRRAAGVLAALSVGDQSAIVRDDWTLFRNTGIAHLVSISGLHVTMFAWLAAALVGAAWRRSPAACLWLAAAHAGRWIGLAMATAYAVLAGWGVPAQRTVGMLVLVTLLISHGRRWPWPMVLCAAAACITLADPWALLQPGFWLSFMAVGLLMASDPAQQVLDRRSRWRLLAQPLLQGLRSQFVATLGLTPLSLVFFQQVSVVGVLANLVAIPVVTLLITPLALLGLFWAPLWQLGAWAVQAMGQFLGLLAAWPGAVWLVPAAPAWAQLAGLLAAVLLVLPWPWRLRLLALPLALPLLFPQRELPAEGRFELLALDVGQGSAVLVRTRSHLLLFDAGPQYSRDSDAGQRVLLPLLQGRGERRIDRLVLSHRDNDHVGGARAVMQALPVVELLGSLEAGHPLHHAGVPSRRCVAGQQWNWDSVDFQVLHPPASDYARGLKPNALSCVIRVAGRAQGSGSALLTGDIERQQELALVAAGADPGLGSGSGTSALDRAAAPWPVVPSHPLRSTVLLAPHHGSRSSSSAELLDAVQPRIGLVQAGYRNRFGHPAPEVLARYRARGVRVIESARCGAWSWHGDAALRQVSCERERVRRHWHVPPADSEADAPP